MTLILEKFKTCKIIEFVLLLQRNKLLTTSRNEFAYDIIREVTKRGGGNLKNTLEKVLVGQVRYHSLS